MSLNHLCLAPSYFPCTRATADHLPPFRELKRRLIRVMGQADSFQIQGGDASSDGLISGFHFRLGSPCACLLP